MEIQDEFHEFKFKKYEINLVGFNTYSGWHYLKSRDCSSLYEALIKLNAFSLENSKLEFMSKYIIGYATNGFSYTLYSEVRGDIKDE